MGSGQRLGLQQRQRPSLDGPGGIGAAVGPKEDILPRINPHQLRMHPLPGQIQPAHMARAKRGDPAPVQRPAVIGGGQVQQLGWDRVHLPGVQRGDRCSGKRCRLGGLQRQRFQFRNHLRQPLAALVKALALGGHEVVQSPLVQRCALP